MVTLIAMCVFITAVMDGWQPMEAKEEEEEEVEARRDVPGPTPLPTAPTPVGRRAEGPRPSIILCRRWLRAQQTPLAKPTCRS